ncbi:hypothetical protein DUK53_16920 [Listeria sp. SHR_NRA_18]|uniref:hypothetical protein n=1 Tax=Listeria sp. SHR_NRA_18 TaxID=2269046 RepID=UPI000F60136A|nr:hypothetical protein [Listeria sp. SHR_NRA_18]RQW65328.1 hypothetical protein DUK53_16920 [Listeria sp. SHR_NRA_18]
MKDLQATVRGMICFQETQDFVAPRSIVQDVWNRIEPQNDWLSFDVYLMSHIFYVFEFDSAATNIVRIADYIARYDDLNANPKLRVSFLLNVLTFYRHHNRIVEAEKYADEAITIAGPFILHRLVAQYRKAEIMYLKGHKEKAMEDANFVFECLKTMRLNAIYDDLLIDWEQTLNMDK